MFQIKNWQELRQAEPELHEQIWLSIRALKDMGFAVLIFSPEHLNGVPAEDLEDALEENATNILSELALQGLEGA